MSLTTFAEQAFADFQATAAIAPSSRFLAQKMVQPLPLQDAEVVVEFGPGTGVMTRELLRLLPSTATVLAFEINPRFVSYLNENFSDPRLHVLTAGAETAGDELRRRGYRRVDAVLSSLGLSMMEDERRHEILQGLAPFLDENSVFTQFQYMQRLQFRDGRPVHYDVRDCLRLYFRHIQRGMVLRNLPPAFVFDCRK